MDMLFFAILSILLISIAGAIYERFVNIPKAKNDGIPKITITFKDDNFHLKNENMTDGDVMITLMLFIINYGNKLNLSNEEIKEQFDVLYKEGDIKNEQ